MNIKGKIQIIKIWIPQNGWFIMENPIKMDDRVPLFLETSICFQLLPLTRTVASEGSEGIPWVVPPPRMPVTTRIMNHF